jgi:DNA-directed RNA polymerase
MTALLIRDVAPAPYVRNRFEDRFQAQVDLEEEMLALGTSRMQDRINRAKSKHDMSQLRPYKNLLHEWVLPVSAEITRWIDATTTKRGVRPIALGPLRQLSADTAAMVALNSILRMLGIEQRHLLSIALEIGTWCEHEARCKEWMEVMPKDWRTTQANFRKRGSNGAHIRRSSVSIFNKFIRDELGWIGWTNEERLRVGLELINCVVTATGRFRIMSDPAWVPKKGKGGAYMKRPYVLEAEGALNDWLKSAMEDELVHAPVFLPTLIPPVDWEGPRDGGYHTPFVKTPFLIRFKAAHQDQRTWALEEFEGLDMPEVYAAINAVQHTAWRINNRVLDVAREVWEKDLALAGLPRQGEEFVPPMPEDAVKGTVEYAVWAKSAGAARTRNAQRLSRFLTYRRAFQVAERFKDEEEFFFPHMLDFRGRMYPIPSDLSPQGEDLHRGLLTFTHGKPVTQEDAGWLAVHLANQFGVDKVSYGDRIQWVKDREAQWKSVDADPLGDRSWIGADDDDNWQRLAAIFEWCRWLREGEGMVSSLPIRVDGTCNGIQHLSAMIRDEVGGAAVNLTPGETPRDIYGEVADILTTALQAAPDNAMARGWLNAFHGKAPRSVTKAPTMILPYGGTKHAYFDNTMDWLKKHDPYCEAFEEGKRAEAVSWLVPYLWDAVEATVIRAREIMDWLQKCAIEAGKLGRPLWWKTPAGFYVRHFYGKQQGHLVETRIDGQRIMLQAYRTTSELSTEDQARAIAPNFVHSMDASALMTCVNLAVLNGVTSLTTIHDAYGTVAADMTTLSSCLREAFIQTYSEPVLENYRLACYSVSGTGTKLPPVPKFGRLDLNEVRDAEYFFA